MTTKSKSRQTADGKPDLGQMTVSEILDNVQGVPLWARFWLERYAAGGDALEPHGLHDDPATYEVARLVYDVLYTDSHVEFAKIDDPLEHFRFPSEARDFIEEWLYHVTVGDSHMNPWGSPDMAVMALPILLNMSAGPPIKYEKDPTLAMLRTALKALTTKRERRKFLNETAEADAEPVKEEGENWHAVYKLSRLLADPRTPVKTLAALVEAVNEFANASQVSVHDAALIRRAFLLMCEAKPKGRVRDCRKARRELLALLDTLPDMADEEGGGNER